LDEFRANHRVLGKRPVPDLKVGLFLGRKCGKRAGAPVCVALWFDTEDYIEPAADDAALRIARELTVLGVRATFKQAARSTVATAPPSPAPLVVAKPGSGLGRAS